MQTKSLLLSQESSGFGDEAGAGMKERFFLPALGCPRVPHLNLPMQSKGESQGKVSKLEPGYLLNSW